MESEFDWYQVKILESMANLKKVLKNSVGREPSTKVARQITACLQQGRLFYESATNAAVEIRPLLIFYGMLAFAKALVVARTFRGLETLAHSHGVEDTSPHNAQLENLQVTIQESGTFQSFNDAVSALERIYYSSGYIRHYLALATCTSDQLRGRKIPLKECLARIPELATLYRNTFEEDEKSIECISIN